WFLPVSRLNFRSILRDSEDYGMWSREPRVCLRTLTGLAMALAIAGPCAGQNFNAAAVALRTTIIKPDSLTLGPHTNRSHSDTFKPIQAHTTYETIPSGGPCAHFESSCQLFKTESCKRHYSRCGLANPHAWPTSSIRA